MRRDRRRLYTAHPSRSGYIRCAACIGEHGWTDVALADHDIFGRPDRTA